MAWDGHAQQESRAGTGTVGIELQHTPKKLEWSTTGIPEGYGSLSPHTAPLRTLQCCAEAFFNVYFSVLLSHRGCGDSDQCGSSQRTLCAVFEVNHVEPAFFSAPLCGETPTRA